MVTGAKIGLAADGRSAVLTRNGRSLRADILEPVSAQFHISSTRPPTAAESQNEGTVLLAIDLTRVGRLGVTRLVVLLTPVGDKWPQLGQPAIKPLADWR
jgi:hypothetical protein